MLASLPRSSSGLRPSSRLALRMRATTPPQRWLGVRTADPPLRIVKAAGDHQGQTLLRAVERERPTELLDVQARRRRSEKLEEALADDGLTADPVAADYEDVADSAASDLGLEEVEVGPFFVVGRAAADDGDDEPGRDRLTAGEAEQRVDLLLELCVVATRRADAGVEDPAAVRVELPDAEAERTAPKQCWFGSQKLRDGCERRGLCGRFVVPGIAPRFPQLG